MTNEIQEANKDINKEEISNAYTTKQLLETFSSIETLAQNLDVHNYVTIAGYDIDDVKTYLNNPLTYHSELRKISDYFYINNGIYRNVINAFANIPTLDNLIMPSSKTLARMTDKSYDVYYDKINSYYDSINVKPTVRTILKSVAKYGGYIGYEREEKGEFYIQTLPLDYCRIKMKMGAGYLIEFNFKYFDNFYQQEDLDLAFEAFPKEFKKLYNKYLNDRQSQTPEWQTLDFKKTRVVLADDDEPIILPMFSGMFLALLNNEEYKEIVKAGETLAITKLLIQEVPKDAEGNVVLDPNLVRQLHANLVAILPPNVNALTTPMKIEEVPFTNQYEKKEELLEKAERGALIASGYSGAMFADNGGHVGLNVNIELVTANIFAILEKIEIMFNNSTKQIVTSKNYDFKITFFRTTSINVKEKFDMLMKTIEIGGAISPLFSILGFDNDIYRTLLEVENELKIKDLLQVPQSMHTQSGKATETTDTTAEAGRPQSQERDLTDGGETARDLDTNNPKSRNK